MKTTLTILLTALTVTTTFGQITTTKVATTTETVDNTPYDSLDNFVGKNPRKYIGQELYLIGKSESLRQYGYEGFYIDYNKSKLAKGAIYKCCDSYNSKYDALNGKYFKVLDVINHPKAKEDELLYGSKFYLKLEEKESKDIVYFEYRSTSIYSFPFIVVGYFEKAKTRYIGTEHVLRGRNWIEKNPEMYDIQNGKPVDFSAGTIWKCVDFTIEEKYYNLSLILENSKGERLAFSMDNILKGVNFAFSKIDADKYKQKFGDENWNLILNGKTKIGMTQEMCRLSLGSPKSINETITSEKKTEQWVYSDGYLYFDNGILTAIQ